MLSILRRKPRLRQLIGAGHVSSQGHQLKIAANASANGETAGAVVYRDSGTRSTDIVRMSYGEPGVRDRVKNGGRIGADDMFEV